MSDKAVIVEVSPFSVAAENVSLLNLVYFISTQKIFILLNYIIMLLERMNKSVERLIIMK